MNLEVSLSDIRKRSLMVATPMYGGNCSGYYTKSIADLSAVCARYDIDLKFFYLFNESLITRARNYCADSFMRSDYTHLMFIDSDIGFNPDDVISLLAQMDPDAKEDKKEVMCGPYPKKTIAWEKVVDAVKQGEADDNPRNLEKYVGDYVFNPADDVDGIYLDKPCRVLEGGTGFMMIQRSALEKFQKAYPKNTYTPDHIRTKHFDGSRDIHMYFQALIDDKSNRYLSEDYMFCQWMRDVGVDTWLCPWMNLSHTGTFTFGGSLADMARLGVTPTADKDKVEKMKE